MVNFIVDCTSVGKTRGPNPLINHSFPLRRHGTTLRWTEVIVCHKYIMFEFLILSHFQPFQTNPNLRLSDFMSNIYIYIISNNMSLSSLSLLVQPQQLCRFCIPPMSTFFEGLATLWRKPLETMTAIRSCSTPRRPRGPLDWDLITIPGIGWNHIWESFKKWRSNWSAHGWS